MRVTVKAEKCDLTMTMSYREQPSRPPLSSKVEIKVGGDGVAIELVELLKMVSHLEGK